MPDTNALWAPVQSPPVAPTRGGLFSVVNLSSVDAPAAVQGVTFPEVACRNEVHVLPQDCWTQYGEGDLGDEKELAGFEWTRSTSFGIYTGVECLTYNDNDYDEIANRRLELGQRNAIARVFKEVILEGPAATHIHADDLADAIAIAEQYAGSIYGGLPVIHMSRANAVCALSEHLAVPGLDWTITTQQGTPIANEAAYGDETSGCDGQIWVTGQVHIQLSPILVNRTQDKHNHTQAIAERYVNIAAECFAVSIGPEETP